MKNEDVAIISLAIVVLIVGAIALIVTGTGMDLNQDAPFESKSPQVNVSNANDTSQTRDTGVSASEASGTSSSSSYNGYSGGGSYYPVTPDTPDSGGEEGGGSDEGGGGDEGGDTPTPVDPTTSSTG